MQTPLIKIIEEMQRQAKVCETVAEDKTQEALTAESCDSERNTQEAKDWMIKSKVWLEAEAVVRALSESTASIEFAAIPPAQPVVPCI